MSASVSLSRGARFLATIGAVVAVAGCGSSASATHSSATHSTATPAASAPVRTATVTIKGYAYHPASLTVAAGARVTFVNDDPTAHTATADGSSAAFDTGTLKPGQSHTVTLAKPGTFGYYCQFHAFMKATITVH